MKAASATCNRLSDRASPPWSGTAAGSGVLGGGEVAHRHNNEELVIALPPCAIVATADAAALVVLVVPYPTALDCEVGGVEELAITRLEVKEHGPELPLHFVVEHEGSGMSRRQR